MATKIEKFEDLEVWQDGIELSVDMFNNFKGCKDYSLKDQICRATVSIPSNIAEGYERQYNKEYVQYLFVAKGSPGEVRTQLLIAFKLGILKEVDYLTLLNSSKKISAQLYNLIKTRKEKFS